MNRHLCRGKRLDNGEWVQGQIAYHGSLTFIIGEVADWNEDYIALESWHRVDPATVGRCTGVVAAKSYRGDTEADRLIWEGDIATYKRSSAYTAHNAVICWSKTDAGFEIKYEHGVDYLQGGDDIEIISTIHNEGSAE